MRIALVYLPMEQFAGGVLMRATVASFPRIPLCSSVFFSVLSSNASQHSRYVRGVVGQSIRRGKLLFSLYYSSTTSCCRCCSVYTASHSCSSCCSGLKNLRFAGVTYKRFGLKQKMAQEGFQVRKVEAGEGVADEDIQTPEGPVKTKRVVEHVVLFKMKDSLTDEQEKEMLDNLWSLQYQIKNVICTTVGRLTQKTTEGYTHALFSRFPTRQALDEYMESTIRWRVAQDLVIPYYDGLIMVDFEADVEDDIETVFRRGDDFQEGLENVVLFKFKDKVSSDAVDKFLKILNYLPEKYKDIVQLTIGINFVDRTKEFFSHGLVARLPSEEVLQGFQEFLKKEPSWVEAMELVETSKTLNVNFLVAPVGKTIM